jgi:hypothetical protein
MKRAREEMNEPPAAPPSADETKKPESNSATNK